MFTGCAFIFPHPLYRVLGLPWYLPTSTQHVLITRRLQDIATQDAQISQDVHNGLRLSTEYTLEELKTILGRQGLCVLSSFYVRWTHGMLTLFWVNSPTTGLTATQLRENLRNHLIPPKEMDVPQETWALVRLGAIVHATKEWRKSP